MKQFNQLVSINHQGVVIVFGRPTIGNTTDIYFNVLGVNTDSNDDALDWSGFEKLEFTQQVRQIGMSIITLKKDDSTIKTTSDPFRVISDQKYISIIQPSAKGTLYINRFKLTTTRSGSDQKTLTYSLSPAWEVRYARSKKEDVPEDASDTQEYLDPDGKPFLEPSLELSMVNSITDGAFDVLLLPIASSDLFTWQFFILDKANNQVNIFNFPATKTGLFDLSSKNINASYQIVPDSSFSIKDVADNELSIIHPPRATVYVKHENVVQPDGSSIGVKRAARVMIALSGTLNSTTVTATIDSAVGNNGTIAKLNGAIQASAITPAEFDLLFDGVSYLTLNAPPTGDNPLEIKGPYSFEFMVMPKALGDQVNIIGGSDNSDSKTLAPFARIVDGNKLCVGFGNGTSLVSCTTKHQVFENNGWTSVKITYKGVGADPFVVSINGSEAPLTSCTTDAAPSGKAVDQIGSSTNGFFGALNTIKISVAGTSVVELPCNTVDYSSTPPTTPNTVASGGTVNVYGAKLEPSSSPSLANMSGQFYIDPMGLSYYVATADFIAPKSAACLIDGSDGLLHLYYQGQNNAFSVAQFSTLSARASFFAEWKTDASEEQTGFLNFVAHRVGSYMNSTVLKVTSSSISSELCDISVEGANDIGTETWTGLPRNVNLLSQIWNGGAGSNPDDQHVINGSKAYFDYTGTIPSVLAPSTNAESGGYFLFTSVPSLPLNIASVQVDAGTTNEFVNITIHSTPPSLWENEQIVQTWPAVPASPLEASETLTGKSSQYNYSSVVTTGTRAYGVPATTSRSDNQISTISIFVQESLTPFSISVENGTSSDKCIVHICGQELENVSRDQIQFTSIINGEDKEFNYPSGYEENIAKKIYAINDGLTATVLNGTIENNQTVGALPYASLLRLLYTGSAYDAGYMAPISKTDATPFQSARLSFNNKEDSISQSMLFGAMVASSPTNGETGKLQNTSQFTDGKAPVLQQGINGGWMSLSPEFCLGFNKSSSKNYVQFNVEKTFSPSDKLAISTDMTLQSWINQDLTKSNATSRAITYNVLGNIDNPTLPIQYMVGSKQGPGLIIGGTTFVNSSYNFDSPNLSVQIYVKPQNTNKEGVLFSIKEVRGSTEFIKLSIDQYGRPKIDFLNSSKTISGNNPLTSNQWTCLTVTVADAGDGNVTISLYYNANEPQIESATNSFTGKLGSFTVGDSSSHDLNMTVNGAAFWQRALSKEEVQKSFSYGFPDNDESLGIRWNFAEGQGTAIMNSATTGSEFNTTVTNPRSPSWDESGAFQVPYMGRNNYVLVSNRILKGWTHTALASKQGYALELNGTGYGKVDDGSPFNPGKSFAVELWLAPTVLTQRQVLLEKPGSYSLYINTIGEICLETTISQEGDYYYSSPTIFKYNIKSTIEANKSSYIAVNFTCGTVDQDASGGSEQFVYQKYYINTSLFINGQKILDNNKEDYTKPLSVNSKNSSFYVGVGGDETFYYKGLISNVRIWGRTLSEEEIANTYDFHLPPTNKDGLVAGWNFDDMSGTVAKDIAESNNLQLSSNQLWSIWQDVAYASLYVNGREGFSARIQAEDVGGYKDSQFTFASNLENSVPQQFLAGEIDDVRIFSTLLTEQQVREAMNSHLTGLEDHLAGYWKIDAGSGTAVYDMTGRGNDGTMLPANNLPTWNTSDAPISNESESVINVLGGKDTIYIADIEGGPSVIEYGATEKDAYGNVIGVMKRGYFFQGTDQKTVLEVGYKVGDLDTIYIGQIQSQPSVVGFIEGGPPIPSENQTTAYWGGTSWSLPTQYNGVCSVNYQESETKSWSFSGSQSSKFTLSFNLKGGPYWKTKSSVSVGIGAESETQVLESKFKLGAKTSLAWDRGSTDGVSQNHTNTSNISNSLTPLGSWEPADNILNPTVGRRFIQNNIGIAVVKSATADLYMLALKNTKTPVSYSVVPNVNIPIDTNIIDFPINPKYIKNGTLDGKVGLENDPDYPNANNERGSYFKPVEAYNLKQKIEKEEQQLKAYYDQFETSDYRDINSLDSLKNKLKESGAYNFDKKVNQRSIFNNYVWSAGGGLHKEEHSVANSYSENYTGSSSLKFAAGLEFIMDIGTPFGGYYLETDVMLGNNWEMTATKSETSSNGFNLACTINPTAFLCAPIMTYDQDGNLEFKGYEDTPAPGKVDGYRYMSFYLAPSTTNFDTLLAKVIDPNWLNNSTSAAANAMRQAIVAENGAWRILYRTTYVSRVPAPFQAIKDDTTSPNVTPPANLDSNYWLIAIISQLITSKNPTPLEIGTAIYQVLGKGGTSNGILNDLIPWWQNFYEQSLVYGTDEFKEMAELREDLLQYMIDKYESDQYENE